LELRWKAPGALSDASTCRGSYQRAIIGRKANRTNRSAETTTMAPIPNAMTEARGVYWINRAIRIGGGWPLKFLRVVRHGPTAKTRNISGVTRNKPRPNARRKGGAWREGPSKGSIIVAVRIRRVSSGSFVYLRSPLPVQLRRRRGFATASAALTSSGVDKG